MTVPDTELIVTTEELRELQYCNREARPWFHRHGLSWDDFLDGKVTAAMMLATGDERAANVVALARQKRG